MTMTTDRTTPTDTEYCYRETDHYRRALQVMAERQPLPTAEEWAGPIVKGLVILTAVAEQGVSAFAVENGEFIEEARELIGLVDRVADLVGTAVAMCVVAGSTVHPHMLEASCRRSPRSRICAARSTVGRTNGWPTTSTDLTSPHSEMFHGPLGFGWPGRCASHPRVRVGSITNDDDLSPDELEQLARSLSMDGSLGRSDAQRVASALRLLAADRRREPGHDGPR